MRAGASGVEGSSKRIKPAREGAVGRLGASRPSSSRQANNSTIAGRGPRGFNQQVAQAADLLQLSCAIKQVQHQARAPTQAAAASTHGPSKELSPGNRPANRELQGKFTRTGPASSWTAPRVD
uniref:Uncharacterized protein n=1 Tax=Setaria viridis TaxID=4556 RepID=A0A4U6SWS8_SETVI|nr:hypothetical protein SEVIR_9G220950v2 [Setaria viridis]